MSVVGMGQGAVSLQTSFLPTANRLGFFAGVDDEPGIPFCSGAAITGLFCAMAFTQ